MVILLSGFSFFMSGSFRLTLFLGEWPRRTLSLYLDILAPYVDILRWSSFSTAPENPWSQMQLFNAKLRSSITIGLKLKIRV